MGYGTVCFSDQGTFVGELTGKIVCRRQLFGQSVVEIDLGDWGVHTFLATQVKE